MKSCFDLGVAIMVHLNLQSQCVFKSKGLLYTTFSRRTRGAVFAHAGKSVAVIGGGLAGLSCAKELCSNGIPVTLIEQV